MNSYATQSECPICLDNPRPYPFVISYDLVFEKGYVHGDRFYRCGHWIHESCWRELVVNNFRKLEHKVDKKCPLCRKKSEPKRVDLGSSDFGLLPSRIENLESKQIIERRIEIFQALKEAKTIKQSIEKLQKIDKFWWKEEQLIGPIRPLLWKLIMGRTNQKKKTANDIVALVCDSTFTDDTWKLIDNQEIFCAFRHGIDLFTDQNAECQENHDNISPVNFETLFSTRSSDYDDLSSVAANVLNPPVRTFHSQDVSTMLTTYSEDQSESSFVNNGNLRPTYSEDNFESSFVTQDVIPEPTYSEDIHESTFITEDLTSTSEGSD